LKKIGRLQNVETPQSTSEKLSCNSGELSFRDGGSWIELCQNRQSRHRCATNPSPKGISRFGKRKVA